MAGHARKSGRSTEQEEYEVEEILDCKKEQGKRLFLIKWKGWSDEWNQWIDESNLNCNALVRKFFRDRENNKRSSTSSSRSRSSSSSTVPRKRTINDAQFDVELRRFLLSRGFQWAVDESRSTDASKVLVRVEQNVISSEEKLRLDAKLNEWIDKVNDKRKLYNLKPLKIENTFDLCEPPTDFEYIVENKLSSDISMSDVLIGCNCKQRCSVKDQCCPKSMDAEFAYRPGGRLLPDFYGQPIFECNRVCPCGIDCDNRVVQRKSTYELCVFRTSDGRGWGLKTAEAIKCGSFVQEYVGEVIVSAEAAKRCAGIDAEYMFDLDFHDFEPEYVIDATLCGGESRFINHSCEPNLTVYATYIDNYDVRMPRIAFFANKDIAVGEELTFDYSMFANNESKDEGASSKQRKKGKTPSFALNGKIECFCSSKKCRGYVFIVQ